MSAKDFIEKYIDENASVFTDTSDKIWENPEQMCIRDRDLTESKLREAVSVTNELRKDPSVSRFFELLTEQWIRNMAELGRMKIPKVRLRVIRRHRL